MVRNNVEMDIKVKLITASKTQESLAGIVNKTFVQMMEALGYDIELTYIKREEGQSV